MTTTWEKPYLFSNKNKRGKPCRILRFRCSREGLPPGLLSVGVGSVGRGVRRCHPSPSHPAHPPGSPSISASFPGCRQAGSAFDSRSQLLLIRTFLPSPGDFAWILDPGDLQLLRSVSHCGFCQDFTSKLPLKGFSLLSTVTVVCETSNSRFFFLFNLNKIIMYFPNYKK